MVRCVVVDIENLEEVRSCLSSRNIIDYNWEIETSRSKGYIAVSDEAELTEYDTCHRDLEQRDKQKNVSELLGYSPTYEWLGDIILLKEDENTNEIVDAFRESSHNPKAILKKCSEIKGKRRIRDWEIVYGQETETVYTENGYEYRLDITETYFSPRLATDRRRVYSGVTQGEKVVDMFAGVGPYAIPCADQGANVVACDINESAIEHLVHNAERNDVTDKITALNLDARKLTEQYEDYANTAIMNLPHSADQFIDSAIELVSNDGSIVYYGFLSSNKNAKDVEKRLNSNVSRDLDKKIVVCNIQRVRPYAPNVDNIRCELDVTNKR